MTEADHRYAMSLITTSRSGRMHLILALKDCKPYAFAGRVNIFAMFLFHSCHAVFMPIPAVEIFGVDLFMSQLRLQ